nr:hypothetical protein B0A51_03084 [Rachicladosporium sp. CCFEE 5018]
MFPHDEPRATLAVMAKQAAHMAEIANKKAAWATDMASWAANLAAAAAADVPEADTMLLGTNANEVSSSTQPKEVVMQSDHQAHQVFATPELLEAILLCDSIDIRHLFSLQRVDKQFQNTISGSIELRQSSARGSWQKTVIKRGASRVTLTLDCNTGISDSDEDASVKIGNTLGELMQGLAILSVAKLDAYFRELSKAMADVCPSAEEKS